MRTVHGLFAHTVRCGPLPLCGAHARLNLKVERAHTQLAGRQEISISSCVCP
jgi:hypothetical protein